MGECSLSTLTYEWIRARSLDGVLDSTIHSQWPQWSLSYQLSQYYYWCALSLFNILFIFSMHTLGTGALVDIPYRIVFFFIYFYYHRLKSLNRPYECVLRLITKIQFKWPTEQHANQPTDHCMNPAQTISFVNGDLPQVSGFTYELHVFDSPMYIIYIHTLIARRKEWTMTERKLGAIPFFLRISVLNAFEASANRN